MTIWVRVITFCLLLYPWPVGFSMVATNSLGLRLYNWRIMCFSICLCSSIEFKINFNFADRATRAANYFWNLENWLKHRGILDCALKSITFKIIMVLVTPPKKKKTREREREREREKIIMVHALLTSTFFPLFYRYGMERDSPSVLKIYIPFFFHILIFNLCTEKIVLYIQIDFP